MTRGEFISGGSALAASALFGGTGGKGDGLIWADLIHLGVDMWIDHPTETVDPVKFTLQRKGPSDTLQCDPAEWRALTDRLGAVGANMVVIDLAEGLRYPSHPELAVKGSWTPEQMRAEIERLRKLGLEAIPKINFSTSHDSWMKNYGRMVSTRKYYEFCSDIIRDVADIFRGARFFHIGMDEEAALNQKTYEHCVVRQGDLWWHDLRFYADEVAKRGFRPWMWSDYAWNNPKEFYSRCPKDIVQSNWYYSASFDMDVLKANRDKEIVAQEVVQMHEIDQVECYMKLEQEGFDQIPCGGNWREDVNLAETVKFCRRHISSKRLLGFLVAPWRRTLPEFHEANMRGVELLGAEIAKSI